MWPSSYEQKKLCWQGIWYGPTKTQSNLHAHHLSVKASSDEALSGSKGSYNGDLKNAVNSKSPGRSWVWFPSTHDLKTHYVCILELKYLCHERIATLGIRLFEPKGSPWSGSANHLTQLRELGFLASLAQLCGA